MLSHNEFMLLSIINQEKLISGYKLNQIIEQRGYRSWADIGSTSIYVNLKRLVLLDYIEGEVSVNKKTKGPSSILYRCKANGVQTLKQETLESLQYSRERDRRFDLALSTITILDLAEIENALSSRLNMLHDEKKRIESILHQQMSYISFPGKLLFDRTLYFIENEIEYTINLKNKIIKEMK